MGSILPDDHPKTANGCGLPFGSRCQVLSFHFNRHSVDVFSVFFEVREIAYTKLCGIWWMLLQAGLKPVKTVVP